MEGEGVVRLIFDGNNLSYAPGQKKPSMKVAEAVRALVLEKLDVLVEESLTIFDSSVYGFCDAAEKKRLRRSSAEDRHFVAPSTKEADEYILKLARESGAMVVSLDNFNDYPKLRAGIPLLKPGIVNPTLFILPHTVDIYDGKTCRKRTVAEVLTSGVQRGAAPSPGASPSSGQPGLSEEVLKKAIIALLESHGGSLRTDSVGHHIMQTEGLPKHLARVIPFKTRRIARLLALWPDRIRLVSQGGNTVVASLRSESPNARVEAAPSTKDSASPPPRRPSAAPKRKTRPTRAEETVRSAILAVLAAGPVPPSAFVPRVYDQVESKAHLNTVIKPGSGAMKRLLKAFPDLLALNKAGEVVSATKVSARGPHTDLEESIRTLVEDQGGAVPRDRFASVLRDALPDASTLDAAVAPGPRVMKRLEREFSHLIENRDGNIVLVSQADAPAPA
jgi:hypothetical protein